MVIRNCGLGVRRIPDWQVRWVDREVYPDAVERLAYRRCQDSRTQRRRSLRAHLLRLLHRHQRGSRFSTRLPNLAFFGHSTSETNLDMQALLASAEFFAGPGIPVPSRNSVLLRWWLQNGLRVVQPMTLMSAGLYSNPAGAWLLS